MIFAIHDWTGGRLTAIPGIERKRMEWLERGGTKKQPTQESRSGDVACIEIGSLEALLALMAQHNFIVQIRLPDVDAQGCGFPIPYIYTDTPAGKFHQR